MLRIVESCIGAKALQLSRRESSGNEHVREATRRFSDEALDLERMFDGVAQLAEEGMPTGYRFVHQGDDLSAFALGKSTWAVLALICQFELSAMTYRRPGIEPGSRLSAVYEDALHLRSERAARHAVLAEIEWLREDERLAARERDGAVDDLIELVQGVDALLVFQAPSDVECLAAGSRTSFTATEIDRLNKCVLSTYRTRHIASGLHHPHFTELIEGVVTEAQASRLRSELAFCAEG